MTSGKKLTDADRSTVLRLHAEHLSQSDISRRSGIHRETVRRIIDQAARDWWDESTRRARLDELTDPC